jgi:hypothetical protein
VSVLITTLLAVGLLIFARRLAGALPTTMSPDVMLLLAVGVATGLALTRVAWRRNFPLETPLDLTTMDRLVGWGSSVALGMLAIGCCYPGNRTVDWLIWLPILVADQLWRQNFFDAGQPWIPLEEELGLAGLPLQPLADASPRDPADALPQGNQIVQQLYRMQDDSGQEVIYGTLRVDFVAGQRTAAVYAGFCPPLQYRPRIEAEALPGTEAKIKIVQELSHGTRLDVRLPAAASADSQIWIDMAARPLDATTKAETEAETA